MTSTTLEALRAAIDWIVAQKENDAHNWTPLGASVSDYARFVDVIISDGRAAIAAEEARLLPLGHAFEGPPPGIDRLPVDDTHCWREGCGQARAAHEAAKPPLHDFEVMAEMSRRDFDIRFAPMSNVRAVNFKHPRGTEFTIGFPGNLCFDVERGKFRGGLVLVDGEQFDKLRADMEATRGR